MSNTRVEKDSMGELHVPVTAIYGAQTQRAINNFPISHQPMPLAFIKALVLLKQAAAQTNLELDCLSSEHASAIIKSCQILLNDDHIMQHFPVDIFQTGSGTSSNMNANEVIASLANRIATQPVDANDHVNFGQSSNDVIPSTIHISASIELDNKLLPALRHLSKTIQEKADTMGDFCKTGRTHLMDAMPIRMDQALLAWQNQIDKNIRHIEQLQVSLHALAQGGTAVGTGINAHPKFSVKFAKNLHAITNIPFYPADNLFSVISSQDTAVALSGQLKTIAVSIMKIANDLRWMNSGPLSGLGEISLTALQPGSSIMPGKVNPIIPEAATMVAAQVIGNDTAVTIGGQSGNFELNVMLPMIAHNLLNSIELLGNVVTLLADKAISDFTVNNDKLVESLDKNPILITALNPIIGYAKAAEIAKLAYAQNRPIIDLADELTDIPRDELARLLNPKKLTQGGF